MKLTKSMLRGACAFVFAMQVLIVTTAVADDYDYEGDYTGDCGSSSHSNNERHVPKGQRRINRGLQRTMRQQIFMAGEESNTKLTLGGSYSSIEDRTLNATGHDFATSAFAVTSFTNSLTLGFGYTHDRYDVKSRFSDFEENMQVIDVILALNITDSLTLAAFANFSMMDIEDNVVGSQDDFHRWGAGIALSYFYTINENFTLGYIGALSSSNKSSLGAMFDDEDTSFINTLDLTYHMNEQIELKVYGTSFIALDRDSDSTSNGFRMDSNYFVYGADVNFIINDSISFAVGYETTACDEDNNENTINASMTLSF